MFALVHGLLAALGVYLLAGVVFSVPFVMVGAARIEPAARGATWGFRLIIVPAAVALWPLLAWRWAGGRPAVERNAHRDRARAAASAGGGG